jgi:NADPH-dependent curcumin reductase CurA
VKSREWRLGAYPQGMPREDDFELAEVELPDPRDGELLIRNEFLSVDPYMRGRMRDARSYVPPYRIGQAMSGGAVGEVVASRNASFAKGDRVLHMHGWRDHALSDGRGVRKVDPELAPLSSYLGVLGMPGLTAYVGLLDIGEPHEGETVFVSAAAGAVGSTAGQIARLKGCRVIGSAGSAEKVAWLEEELGFDAAFDYKRESIRDALSDGIDVYFDNVGGEHLEAALGALRPFGRIVACGAVSRYNDERGEPGPRNLQLVVGKRLRMQGFIVFDHFDRLPEFLRDMTAWLRSGDLRYRETVVTGIEHVPRAFIGLLSGDNIGKMVVDVR